MKIGKRHIKSISLDKSSVEWGVFFLLRQRAGNKGYIKKASISAIAQIIGTSRQTAKKYIGKLKELGLVCFEGKKNNVLRFYKVHSNSTYKNIEIDDKAIDYTSLKSVIMSVRAMPLYYKIKVKDDVRSTACTLENPKNLQEYRDAKSNVRRVGGFDPYNPSYKEYGLCLATIAKLMGTSKRTAQKVTNWAVEKGLIIKRKVCEWLYCPGINYRKPSEVGLDDYTFSSENYVYKVFANVYENSSSLLLCS